jgi:hypothetical protein
MSRILQAPFFAFKTATANGAGACLDVRDYQSINLAVYTSGNSSATIKVAVSNSLVQPNFAIAPSVTNVYDYVQICPINSQQTADRLSGSTGIVLSGTDIVKMYEVNSSNASISFKWLCPVISLYTAGSITVEVTASIDVNK